MSAHNQASDAHSTQFSAKANASDLNAHTGNKANPHGVTAAQVGAAKPGNVFTVTLLASGWSEKSQTVNDERFVTSGYAFITNPADASFTAWAEAVIHGPGRDGGRADDLTCAGDAPTGTSRLKSSDWRLRKHEQDIQHGGRRSWRRHQAGGHRHHQGTQQGKLPARPDLRPGWHGSYGNLFQRGHAAGHGMDILPHRRAGRGDAECDHRVHRGRRERQASQAITVQKASFAVPSQGSPIVYTGGQQSPDWTGYDSAEMTIGGTSAATDAGDYQAIFSLKDKVGTEWADGTTEDKTVSWSIGRATVNVPTQSGSLTYNGSAQSPSWSGYDSSKMTMGGTTSGTNAGSYDANFTTTANYQWPDGTTEAKTVSWSIQKAAGSLSISPESMTLDTSATSKVITVTRAGTGAISAQSSAPTIASVSVSGNQVTVTALPTAAPISPSAWRRTPTIPPRPASSAA